MDKEITKLILGIIIVGGTILAVFYRPEQLNYLVGLSGLIIGYYFKDITGGFSEIFKGNR